MPSSFPPAVVDGAVVVVVHPSTLRCAAHCIVHAIEVFVDPRHDRRRHRAHAIILSGARGSVLRAAEPAIRASLVDRRRSRLGATPTSASRRESRPLHGYSTCLSPRHVRRSASDMECRGRGRRALPRQRAFAARFEGSLGIPHPTCRMCSTSRDQIRWCC